MIEGKTYESNLLLILFSQPLSLSVGGQLVVICRCDNGLYLNCHVGDSSYFLQ